MARLIMLIWAMAAFVMADAATFSYRFHMTPLPKAIQLIMESHPDIDINFIYDELENYKTCAHVDADSVYDALRQTIGLNPVTVVKAKDTYYVEAMQHGKYVYTGQAIGIDNEPVVAATVMLLAPKDATVLTYAIADKSGRFRIPCDRTDVIAKLSCIGYKTVYHWCNTFNIGTIIMPEEAVKLGEVKVEAENARLFSDRSIFIPTGRQKNAAQNAIDLLQQMAIPLIRINPVTNAVTDNAGVTVALYVNNLEVTPEDLAGMRMSDVLRVEYLESPADPRFHGAQRVINFILREYEYGGYTKLTANEKILAGFYNNSSIFTRFNFKKMTYDLFIGANNESSHHSGNSSESTYNLTSAEGARYTLTRDESLESSNYHKNEYPVTVRATYNTGNIQIRNQIGFTNSSVPVNEYQGKLMYDDIEIIDAEYCHRNPNRSNSLSYFGTYYFALPKDFSFSFSPRFNYTHLIDHTTYITPLTDLQRSAKENATDYRGDLFLRKSLGQKHSLTFGVNHGGFINGVNYEGAQRENDKFNSTFSAVLTGYQFNYQKFSLYADAGYAWETTDINRFHTSDSYPFTHINFNVALSQKHLFSAYFQLASSTPLLSMKTHNIVRENEVLYISGNPRLKASRLTTVNLAYTWMPSNSFGMSVYGFCESNYSRMLAVYEPFMQGAAVKRSYINSGDLIVGEIGLPVNWKPLSGKLQLYVGPRLAIYKSTGVYDVAFSHFQCLFQATYYAKDFYIQAFWKTREKTMDNENPSICVSRNFHSLILGWSNGAWNLRIVGNNMFNSGWKDNVTITTSPYFSERKTAFSTSYHPRINFSVTYTLGYGKKIQNDNEVGGQSGAASAILK